MITDVLSWAEAYEDVLLWMAALSLFICLGSILVLPFLAALIPQDYFADTSRHRPPLRRRHPAVYLSIRAAKNLVGWLLVGAGILMLVLPGQGLLTILIGLVLSEFPGKFALERRIAANDKIMSGVNWLRSRAGRPPLQVPEPSQDPSSTPPETGAVEEPTARADDARCGEQGEGPK